MRANTPNEHHWLSTGSMHIFTYTTLWRHDLGLYSRDSLGYKVQTCSKCSFHVYPIDDHVELYFCSWDGVMWAMKEIYPVPPPPNYSQNCHFQRCKNMNFIFVSQSDFICYKLISQGI